MAVKRPYGPYDTAMKSILWETLFLDQLHDFSLKNLDNLKNFIFEGRIW